MTGIGTIFDERIEQRERRRKEARRREREEEKRREKARELRAKERQFIVPPLPKIIKKKKEGFLKKMENKAFNKIFGPIGSALKSRIEKFKKLRKYLTNFTVESEFIWYRKAKGYLDNPDGDDSYDEIDEIKRMHEKAEKKASDEIKGRFKK